MIGDIKDWIWVIITIGGMILSGLWGFFKLKTQIESHEREIAKINSRLEVQEHRIEVKLEQITSKLNSISENIVALKIGKADKG